jgi:hypothetical protein
MADMAWAKLWEEATNAVEAAMSAITGVAKTNAQRDVSQQELLHQGQALTAKNQQSSTLIAVIFAVLIFVFFLALFLL